MLYPLSANQKKILKFIISNVNGSRKPVLKKLIQSEVAVEMQLSHEQLESILRWLCKGNYVRLNSANHGRPTSFSLLRETEY